MYRALQKGVLQLECCESVSIELFSDFKKLRKVEFNKF